MRITPSCLALFLFAPVATLNAQGNASSTSNPIVVVGCVNQPSQTGSLAATPGVPPATPNTAGALANASTPTNTFVLNGAKQTQTTPSERRAESAPGRAPAELPSSYMLDGAREELERHLGHQVEVTGTTQMRDTQGPTAGNVPHIAVRSVRMLAASCEKPPSTTAPKK